MWGSFNCKFTQDQKLVLSEFLVKHPELISAKFSPEFRKIDAQKLWQEITAVLNSIPNGGIKSWKQWRRTWGNWQARTKTTKETIAKLHNDIKQGICNESNLSEIDFEEDDEDNSVDFDGNAMEEQLDKIKSEPLDREYYVNEEELAMIKVERLEDESMDNDEIDDQYCDGLISPEHDGFSDVLATSEEEGTSNSKDGESVICPNTIPEVSKVKYDAAYNLFHQWHKDHKAKSYSEKVLMAYFVQLALKFKPSTLWARYSMLRATLHKNNDVDISKYDKLRAFLKSKSNGYRPKKSKIFSRDEIEKFILEAPDNEYLLAKVILIMGTQGACRKKELHAMKITDIKDLGSAILVEVPNRNSKAAKKFTITGYCYEVFKKYLALRPANVHEFFVNYHKGKCTNLRVGLNKFGNVGKQIAVYLKLPNPELYTGLSLVESGDERAFYKRHGRWKSTQLVETYVEDLNINSSSGSTGNVQQPPQNVATVDESTPETPKHQDSDQKKIDYHSFKMEHYRILLQLEEQKRNALVQLAAAKEKQAMAEEKIAAAAERRAAAEERKAAALERILELCKRSNNNCVLNHL